MLNCLPKFSGHFRISLPAQLSQQLDERARLSQSKDFKQAFWGFYQDKLKMVVEDAGTQVYERLQEQKADPGLYYYGVVQNENNRLIADVFCPKSQNEFVKLALDDALVDSQTEGGIMPLNTVLEGPAVTAQEFERPIDLQLHQGRINDAFGVYYPRQSLEQYIPTPQSTRVEIFSVSPQQAQWQPDLGDIR